MAIGNYSKFLPKHVTGIQFGSTIWSEADMASTTIALDTSFATNNSSPLLNLAGTADTVNPTASYAFAKDITGSGNERNSSSEDLIGSLDGSSQNTESFAEANSLQEVEFTLVYRNTVPISIFNDTTTACLMTLDNSESAATGVLNIAFTNITINHVGSLTLSNTGMMEQKLKFSCRGGLAGSVITCTQTSPAEVWSRVRLGLDYAEEIRIS